MRFLKNLQSNLLILSQDARDIHGELKLYCERVEDVHFKGAGAKPNYCQVGFYLFSFRFENFQLLGQIFLIHFMHIMELLHL